MQERIGKRWDALARQGIYVTSTGQKAQPCVSVELVNPTRPNIEYVRRQFGANVCVERRPGDDAQACSGYVQLTVPSGSARVPDLRDLGLYEATRRAVASYLRYSLDCLGESEKRAKPLPRHSPEQLVRVTKQCPRPGEMVPPGTAVALEGNAVLPGGFEYKVSPLTDNVSTSRPCADGRHASPPGSSN